MGGKVIFKKETEKYWKEASLSKSNGMVETVEEGLKLERGSREMEARLASPRVWLSTRFLQESNRLRLLFREQFRSDGGWRGGPLAAEPTRMSIPAICHEPQSIPTSLNGETFVVDDERNTRGEDGETDDFLKFLRIFDETPSSASFFEYIPFNRSTEREIINPFVPSYYTLFSNTRKYWEIRYSFRFETQLYNNNNTLSQNPFKQIGPRLDYYVAISFSLINSLQHFVKPSSNYPPCPNLSPRSLYRSRPSLDPPNQFAAPWLLNPRPNRRCSLL